MKAAVVVGQVYQHYKGNLYKVIAIGRSSEEPTEFFVVYQGLHDCPDFGKNPIWVRPYEMFVEAIVYNQQVVPRFTHIEM